MAAEKLIPFATKTLPADDKLFQIVDFLNKNLKQEKIMFGLTKDTAENTMTISIYRV